MNTEIEISNEYKLGDLITLYDDSEYIGLIIDKTKDVGYEGFHPAYLYKVLFCGEEEPDARWIYQDVITPLT